MTIDQLNELKAAARVDGAKANQLLATFIPDKAQQLKWVEANRDRFQFGGHVRYSSDTAERTISAVPAIVGVVEGW